MNRFEYVTSIAEAPESESLKDLAAAFAEAVAQVETEKRLPTEDPAVLVMGAYIAFHTHADVNTLGGYRRLVQACHDRLHPPAPQGAH